MNGTDPNQSAIEAALAHHRAGRLAEAERIYRHVLAREPHHPPALGLLGVIAHQTGNSNVAVDLLARSVRLNPQSAGMFNNLGLAQLALGRLDDAHASFESALRLEPNHVPARMNLGNVLVRRGEFEEAMRCYERALELSPNEPEALTSLADLLIERGEQERGIEMHRRAIELAPTYAAAYNNLGKALVDIDPPAAAAAFARAIELQPNYALAVNNLGLLRTWEGYPVQAVELHRRAVQLAPDYSPVHQQLGIALLTSGRVQEAVAAHRKAIEVDPAAVDAHDNLLWSLLFDHTVSAAEVFAEFRTWAARHADPITANAPRPLKRARSAQRRLHIGYVSGDFRDHAVAHFIEPVLANHDAARVAVYCYSNVRKTDDVTRRLQSYPSTWRDIAGRSDDAVAQQIRDDEIDVLIDLAGHSALNRLLVFARRPAPVQVTWLGYPNTTGMRAIDYWITDAYCDPPGQTESLATEQLLLMPRTFTCYAPPMNAPAVVDAPASASGRITFGSFNMIAKINDEVMALWAKVLEAVKDSRLLIVTPMIREKRVHEWLTGRFAAHGVSSQRLDIRPAQDVLAYLATHNEVDIVLDTFPFTGHTVTLNALWMGCPVVALAGNTHISRRGVSVMENLGLPELIAKDKEQFVTIATDRAGELEQLNALRHTLRKRMRNSPLLDAATFTRHLEDALERLAS